MKGRGGREETNNSQRQTHSEINCKKGTKELSGGREEEALKGIFSYRPWTRRKAGERKNPQNEAAYVNTLA